MHAATEAGDLRYAFRSYSPAWLAALDRDLSQVPTADLLASAVEAVARHVQGGLERLPEPPREVLVAGGGGGGRSVPVKPPARCIFSFMYNCW